MILDLCSADVTPFRSGLVGPVSPVPVGPVGLVPVGLVGLVLVGPVPVGEKKHGKSMFRKSPKQSPLRVLIAAESLKIGFTKPNITLCCGVKVFRISICFRSCFINKFCFGCKT